MGEVSGDASSTWRYQEEFAEGGAVTTDDILNSEYGNRFAIPNVLSNFR